MVLTLKMLSYQLLAMAAIMILTLAEERQVINGDVKNTSDSIVTDIITKGTIERIDELMVLKYYQKDIFMMCIGDIKKHKYFVLFFVQREPKPTLLMILKVESCKEGNDNILGHSVILKSYDSDLTNIEVMVRVKNKGCERYTSMDKRMSPCDCWSIQHKHDWRKLSPTESMGILQEIRTEIGSISDSVQENITATSRITALTDPIDSMKMEMQEIADKTTIMQFTPTSNALRKKRDAWRVVKQIVAIPVCAVAFIIMAPICVVWYGVKFALVGIVGGVELAKKGVEKMLGA